MSDFTNDTRCVAIDALEAGVDHDGYDALVTQLFHTADYGSAILDQVIMEGDTYLLPSEAALDLRDLYGLSR